MLLEPDLAAGTVRADDAGVAALLAAAGGEPRPEVADALGDGRLAAALPVLADPLVRVSLVVASSDVRLEHRAWVSPDHLVLALGVRPGLVQLHAQDPAYLTAALVRLTRMRPRRVEERPEVAFPTERLPELVAEDGGVRAPALADAGADLAWRLEARWHDGERLLTAVDGRHGVRLADPATARLRPVSNTVAYRVLSTLLPTDAELAQPV